jgi:rubrerythrin
LLVRELGMKNSSNAGTGFEFKKIKESYNSNISDSTEYDQGRVMHYCMNCGYKHREMACPECGSK